MYTEVHGIRMHYRIDGRDGAPWVTFINGIANDTTLWDAQIPALARDFRLLRFRDRIDRIRVPTLFISGADDQRGGPPAIMQELADAVPGARHISVPHAAHICNIQNADGFNEVLGGFLRARRR